MSNMAAIPAKHPGPCVYCNGPVEPGKDKYDTVSHASWHLDCLASAERSAAWIMSMDPAYLYTQKKKGGGLRE